MAALAPGDVLRLFFQTTKPPKWKRCVVVALSPTPTLLLINSEINEFVIRSDELRALQVLIEAASHDFMQWDSWIDCTQLFGYPLDWLEGAVDSDPRVRLGQISDATRRAIINCVANTRLHSPKKKAVIIDGLTTPDDDD